MDDRIAERAVTGFVKLVFHLRLVAVVLTLLWLLPGGTGRLPVLSSLLAVVAATSLLPLLYWERLAPLILRHPAFLIVDLAVAVIILGTTSVGSPFLFFVLATGLLAGVLHGWGGAAVVGGSLLLAYAAGVILEGIGPASTTFAETLGVPALIPLAAAAGAAVGRLLRRQAATASALADSVMAAAAARERTRLAREMHDSLAKTLHGVALAAGALPALARSDPDAATETARVVADAAGAAAGQARALITDLRSDDLERPLGEAVTDAAGRWSDGAGVRATVAAHPCEGASPSSRYELFCIVREALRNVAAHADATHVRIRLHEDGDVLRLEVRDDGRGFAAPADLDRLAEDGHFGVVGMAERARSIGGRLELDSRPGAGTVLTATVPVTAPGEQPGQLRPRTGPPEAVAP